MAVQVVFTTKFQGDAFVIYRWHAKHYAFGQVKENGEEVWSGTSHTMLLAMEALFVRFSIMADEIDHGATAIGPFLDENGKEIVA